MKKINIRKLIKEEVKLVLTEGVSKLLQNEILVIVNIYDIWKTKKQPHSKFIYTIKELYDNNIVSNKAIKEFIKQVPSLKTDLNSLIKPKSFDLGVTCDSGLSGCESSSKSNRYINDCGSSSSNTGC